MEVEKLTDKQKQDIIGSSPIPIRDRLHQIESSIAFNAYCGPDKFEKIPGLAYSHTVTMCYISFVYFAESLFDKLSKGLDEESPGRKCAKYLRNNPVRAFRNAIAHGNWKFRSTAIEYWARKGNSYEEPMVKWEVTQEELIFWYVLARSIGYSALSGICAK